MHIPQYSQIVSPRYLVTWKKNNFKWDPEQLQAFEQIKRDCSRSSPWASQDGTGCEECVLHRSQGEWSFMESLAKGAHVPKSQAMEEHRNNEPQVDQTAKIEVSQVALDWQHNGVDLTMDTISYVIYNCETCAAIKQAKHVKPLWYGGQ
ncbi:hypothetical protein BTVI_49981 [Pitangus sulphuratus]|nr:hypothetical protein BTVI_49981 [Pitangus sulphuratus]